MVWAEDIGDGKVATYWVSSPEPVAGGVWLIRQGELPSAPGGGIPTVPPNYLPVDSGREGAIPFNANGFFFWLSLAPVTSSTDPIFLVEGADMPPVTTYPRNGIYEP
jgi:hypothetical protein